MTRSTLSLNGEANAASTRPNNITPLLQAFFGAIAVQNTKKQAMRRAWKLAAGTPRLPKTSE